MFSLPDVIPNDRGTVFISELMTKLNWLLDMSMNISTVFHPRTDQNVTESESATHVSGFPVVMSFGQHVRLSS
jgi:hypothetical protein